MRSFLVMLIGLLAVSTGFCLAADDANEQSPWYARPIAADRATLDVLDDMGANSAGFRFHLPPDTKLIVTIVAKNEKGEPIEELSSVHELTPFRKREAFDTSVRVARIDPGRFIENYEGKVRWVMHVGITAHETWQPNRYTATRSRDSWWQGNAFEAIEPGKSYLLWRVKAYPNDLHGIDPDSPSTFLMQIHFRYQPMTAADRHGKTMELFDGEQEFNRVVEDPREHASDEEPSCLNVLGDPSPPRQRHPQPHLRRHDFADAQRSPLRQESKTRPAATEIRSLIQVSQNSARLFSFFIDS